MRVKLTSILVLGNNVKSFVFACVDNMKKIIRDVISGVIVDIKGDTLERNL